MVGICYYCEYATWKGKPPFEEFAGCKYPRRYCPITGDYLGPILKLKDGTITEGELFDDVSLDTIQ